MSFWPSSQKNRDISVLYREVPIFGTFLHFFAILDKNLGLFLLFLFKKVLIFAKIRTLLYFCPFFKGHFSMLTKLDKIPKGPFFRIFVYTPCERGWTANAFHPG
jgi:hypothetical protein